MHLSLDSSRRSWWKRSKSGRVAEKGSQKRGLFKGLNVGALGQVGEGQAFCLEEITPEDLETACSAFLASVFPFPRQV